MTKNNDDGGSSMYWRNLELLTEVVDWACWLIGFRFVWIWSWTDFGLIYDCEVGRVDLVVEKECPGFGKEEQMVI